MKPLSRRFNVAVHTVVGHLFPTGYDVGPCSPATFEALQKHVKNTGRILVWDGNSDHTIYADAETNWAFRAWHDWTHNRWNLDFSDEGEATVCQYQKGHLALLYGRDYSGLAFFERLLHFEVIDMLDYKNQNGDFPVDQMAYARELGL